MQNKECESAVCCQRFVKPSGPALSYVKMYVRGISTSMYIRGNDRKATIHHLKFSRNCRGKIRYQDEGKCGVCGDCVERVLARKKIQYIIRARS